MTQHSTVVAGDRVEPGVDLVEAIRVGDEAAFAGIVRLWSPFLLRTALLLTADEDAARALVRETWLQVLREMAGFRPPTRLRARVCAVLLRTAGVPATAAEADDGPAVDPGRFLPPDDQRWPGHWAVPPAEWPAMADVRDGARGVGPVLRRGLTELPVQQRVVVGLRDMAGCEVAEISEILSQDRDEVRRLLHQGRSALRGQLEAHFLARTA